MADPNPTPRQTAGFRELQNRLRAMKRVAIAFSGGVDSTFLLKAAAQTLPPNDVLAVTVAADIHPDWELREAEEFASDLGVEHRVIRDIGSADPEFALNPPDRCYICKKRVFTLLKRLAAREGFISVLDGENADDGDDFRPGSRAAKELGILSPLRDAGLTKNDIRVLSHYLGLKTWDKPAYACLASRFPYGTPITTRELKRIDRAERRLRALGLHQVRLRHHGTLARIEVREDDIALCAEPETRRRILAAVESEGWLFITLDLRGYRMGSLNRELACDDKKD